MPGDATPSPPEWAFLLALQRQALRYFLDNQVPGGLIRDPALALRGRYGFSAVNLDHHWVGHDMVGIDAGAAVLALDNYLMNNRVRCVFHSLPCVMPGLQRLGFTHVEEVGAAPSVRDEP